MILQYCAGVMFAVTGCVLLGVIALCTLAQGYHRSSDPEVRGRPTVAVCGMVPLIVLPLVCALQPTMDAAVITGLMGLMLCPAIGILAGGAIAALGGDLAALWAEGTDNEY